MKYIQNYFTLLILFVGGMVLMLSGQIDNENDLKIYISVVQYWNMHKTKQNKQKKKKAKQTKQNKNINLYHISLP